jgi:hypothetical protein
MAAGAQRESERPRVLGLHCQKPVDHLLHLFGARRDEQLRTESSSRDPGAHIHDGEILPHRFAAERGAMTQVRRSPALDSVNKSS